MSLPPSAGATQASPPHIHTTPAPCMIREEIRYTRRVRDAETRSAESVPAPKPGACDVDAIAFSLLLSKIERYLKSSTALIAHEIGRASCRERVYISVVSVS